MTASCVPPRARQLSRAATRPSGPGSTSGVCRYLATQLPCMAGCVGFNLYTEGITVPASETCAAVEAGALQPPPSKRGARDLWAPLGSLLVFTPDAAAACGPVISACVPLNSLPPVRQDLDRLPSDEVARICEWITEKVDSFTSKLKPEAKDADIQAPPLTLPSCTSTLAPTCTPTCTPTCEKPCDSYVCMLQLLLYCHYFASFFRSGPISNSRASVSCCPKRRQRYMSVLDEVYLGLQEEEEGIGDVDLFQLEGDVNRLGVQQKWLGHLAERQLGEDGHPRKVAPQLGPLRRGCRCPPPGANLSARAPEPKPRRYSRP